MASRQRPDLLDQSILSWCRNPGRPRCVRTLAHLLTGLGNINRPLRATCMSFIGGDITSLSMNRSEITVAWAMTITIALYGGPGESSSYSNDLSYGVEFSFAAKRPGPDS
ncbi:hypothetical protein VNO77_07211 [Canavalia gladiata]|uniref:Uncharacterized protein n=1 Tax=Canavalia gladiata TaxID=3824 RepID=A0AAN9M869_CANGL